MEEAIANAPELEAKQGTEIVLMMGSPAIPCGMRTSIARAVSSKVTGVKAKKGGKQTTFIAQECPEFQNLGTKKMWDALLDPNGSPSTSLANVAFVMERLGCTNGSSPSWVSAVSCIIGANMTKTGNGAVNPGDAYTLLNRLKKQVRLTSKKTKLPHYGEIKVFPDSPEALKASFPHIYNMVFQDADKFPDNAPAPCPLDSLMLSALKSRLPSRSTHSSLSFAMPSVNGFKRLPSLTMPLTNGSGVDGIDLPGFRLCKPGPTHFASQAALMDVDHSQWFAHSVAQAIQHGIAQHGGGGVSEQARGAEAAKDGTENTCSPIGASSSIHKLAAQISIHKLAAQIQNDIAPAEQKDIAPETKVKKAPVTTKAKKASTPKQPCTPSLKRPAAAAEHLQNAPKKLKAPAFPGKPKKQTDPLLVNGYQVYTDLTKQAWRIKAVGERNDKGISWKADAKEAWNDVCNYLKRSK